MQLSEDPKAAAGQILVEARNIMSTRLYTSCYYSNKISKHNIN